jgi:hypothetical protein
VALLLDDRREVEGDEGIVLQNEDTHRHCPLLPCRRRLSCKAAGSDAWKTGAATPPFRIKRAFEPNRAEHG